MASVKKILFLFMIMLLPRVLMGAVYKVGDSAGWSINGNVDYNNWASSKTFHAGDTLVFEYNVQFHNVMQVSPRDYKSCNDSALPLAVYVTGNDAITLKRAGNYYFICGAPGHCKVGQKVEIKVVPLPLSPSSSIAPSSSSSSMAPVALSTAVPPTTSNMAPVIFSPVSSNAVAFVPSKALLAALISVVLALFLGRGHRPSVTGSLVVFGRFEGTCKFLGKC